MYSPPSLVLCLSYSFLHSTGFRVTWGDERALKMCIFIFQRSGLAERTQLIVLRVTHQKRLKSPSYLNYQEIKPQQTQPQLTLHVGQRLELEISQVSSTPLFIRNGRFKRTIKAIMLLEECLPLLSC